MTSLRDVTLFVLEPYPLLLHIYCICNKTKLILPESLQSATGYYMDIFFLTVQALTLDCGNHWPGGPVNQKIHWPPKKPTGPPKTCNDPNVFAVGIYDFTREVAHFCTLLILGIFITKNKYELTLPSEFCRFPVKILAAYKALKKQKINKLENKLWWPELARQPQKGMRPSGHIANVKACC